MPADPHPARSPAAVTTWTILIALTLVSYASWAGSRLLAPWIGGSVVIVIALTKGWLIGMRYMELDAAFLPLRIAYTVWLLVVGAVLLVMFARHDL